MKLAIDGNFFINRIRSAVGLKFIEDPEMDREQLLYECTRSLCSEIRRLPEIDKVFIARDSGSWRKSFEQVYPIGKWKDEEEQTYKANREGEKDFDAKLFYKCYDEWIDLLETKLNIPVIKHYKAEADDICALIAQQYSKNNLPVLLWTSDGDYVQNLQKNVYLLKFPKRQLWADLSMCGQKSIFNLNENLQFDTLRETFKSDDIIYENPTKSIFKKMVYGDGKDNVPPTFFWLNSKGGRRRPSDSFIQKALEHLVLDVDQLANHHIYDEKFLRDFFSFLLWECKQTKGIEHSSKVRKIYDTSEKVLSLYEDNEASKQLEHALKVYASNRTMKLLDDKQIPEDIRKGIFDQMREKQSMKHDIEVLKDFNKTAKLMGIAEPVKKDSYFNNFNLTAVKSEVQHNGASENHSASESSTIEKPYNILNDILGNDFEL